MGRVRERDLEPHWDSSAQLGAPGPLTRPEWCWASSFQAGLYRQGKCLLSTYANPQPSAPHPPLLSAENNPASRWAWRGGSFHPSSLYSCVIPEATGVPQPATGAWLVPDLHQKPSLGSQPNTKCQRLPRSTCSKRWPAPPRPCRLGSPALRSTPEASPFASPSQVLSLVPAR